MKETIKKVEGEIAAVNTKIDKVESDIQEAEEKQLREEKKQLREKEKQLREEKKQLMDRLMKKEEDLRQLRSHPAGTQHINRQHHRTCIWQHSSHSLSLSVSLSR